MRLSLPARDTVIDSARLALQSATAAVAVVLLMRAFELPHLTWAVISALYVSQHSLDGTLGAVKGRLLGSLIGAAVGLALVHLLGGEHLVAVRLAIAALVINAIASVAPGLRYGVVAAAIITVDPGADVVAGAIDRVVAIAIGSVAGASSAFLVWPQSSYARGLVSTRRALQVTGDLLDASVNRVLDADTDPQPLHDQFLKHVQRARAQIAEARTHRRSARHLERAIHAIERLWHTLVVLDRLSDGQQRRRGGGISELDERLQAVRRDVCDYIARLLPAFGRSTPPSHSTVPRQTLQAARDAASRRIPGTDGRTTGGLAFVFAELEKHLDELVEAAGQLR